MNMWNQKKMEEHHEDVALDKTESNLGSVQEEPVQPKKPKLCTPTYADQNGRRRARLKALPLSTVPLGRKEMHAKTKGQGLESSNPKKKLKGDLKDPIHFHFRI